MTTTTPGGSPDDRTARSSTDRRRDAEATRKHLLTAARARFLTHGYDRTTLRDVAADAGVNMALIKRYFDSKEGLFKAALGSVPRFPDGDGAAPDDRTTLAETLSRQLTGHMWPELGEHPVLLLLRVSGDERVDSLRRQSLYDFSRQVLAASGESSEEDDAERLLRAELVVALGVGIAVVRSAVGLQPLRSATAEELLVPLREVIDTLLGPPPEQGDQPGEESA